MTEQELLDAYCRGWKSMCATARELKINRETYRRFLKKHGVDTSPRHHQSKYRVAADIFDHIDTEQKAYWLGFLYADGHITDNNSIILALSRKDEKHIIAFRDFLQSNHRIYHTVSRIRLKTYPSSRLVITNWYLAKRLKELGIVTGRTRFNRFFSHLPKQHYRHFIRGFFDGDGCAATARSRLIFAGAKDILSWIRRVFSDKIDTNSRQKIVPHSMSKKMCYIEYGGRHQTKRIADWMYQDATIWLNRKRIIIDSYNP